MNWVGLIIAITGLVSALPALIYALKARNAAAVAQGLAAHANRTINTHIVKQHDAFPIQPEEHTQ